MMIIGAVFAIYLGVVFENIINERWLKVDFNTLTRSVELTKYMVYVILMAD